MFKSSLSYLRVWAGANGGKDSLACAVAPFNTHFSQRRGESSLPATTLGVLSHPPHERRELGDYSSHHSEPRGLWSFGSERHKGTQRRRGRVTSLLALQRPKPDHKSRV